MPVPPEYSVLDKNVAERTMVTASRGIGAKNWQKFKSSKNTRANSIWDIGDSTVEAKTIAKATQH